MHEYNYCYVCDPMECHESSENLTQTGQFRLTIC